MLPNMIHLIYRDRGDEGDGLQAELRLREVLRREGGHQSGGAERK